MPYDVLAELAALPDVATAAGRARDAVDVLLWDRAARRAGSALVERSALRGAWANAAMDGAEVPFDALLAGRIEDSPMGVRTARTVALAGELPGLVDVFARSPLQAWATMDAVLVGGLVPESEVGRPRSGEEVEDPLRIGSLPPAPQVADRLTLLSDLIVAPTQAPALVLAGVVHGELAVLRPFRHASGPVARATIRLTLAAKGVDPDMLSVPESALLARGRGTYLRALRDFATGTPQGLASWLVWFSGVVAAGAQEAQRTAVELPRV